MRKSVLYFANETLPIQEEPNNHLLAKHNGGAPQPGLKLRLQAETGKRCRLAGKKMEVGGGDN